MKKPHKEALLIDMDILRGFDIGLPTYNDARQKFNMNVFKHFEDFQTENNKV